VDERKSWIEYIFHENANQHHNNKKHKNSIKSAF